MHAYIHAYMRTCSRTGSQGEGTGVHPRNADAVSRCHVEGDGSKPGESEDEWACPSAWQEEGQREGRRGRQNVRMSQKGAKFEALGLLRTFVGGPAAAQWAVAGEVPFHVRDS